MRPGTRCGWTGTAAPTTAARVRRPLPGARDAAREGRAVMVPGATSSTPAAALRGLRRVRCTSRGRPTSSPRAEPGPDRHQGRLAPLPDSGGRPAHRRRPAARRRQLPGPARAHARVARPGRRRAGAARHLPDPGPGARPRRQRRHHPAPPQAGAIPGRPGLTIRGIAAQPPLRPVTAGQKAHVFVDARGGRTTGGAPGRGPAGPPARPRHDAEPVLPAPGGASGVYLLELRAGGAGTRPCRSSCSRRSARACSSSSRR